MDEVRGVRDGSLSLFAIADGKAELSTIRESIGAQLASADSYGALERTTENAHSEEQLVRGAARQALALARALALTLPAAEAPEAAEAARTGERTKRNETERTNERRTRYERTICVTAKSRLT